MKTNKWLTKTTLVAGLMSAVLLVPMAHAQDDTATSQAVSGQPTASGFIYDAASYTNTPFDLSLTKLPPAYKGIDPALLCMNLGKNFPGKSEFETTDAYNARVATAKTTPVIGTVTPQSLMAFQIEPTSITTLYDADHHKMNVMMGDWLLFTKISNVGAAQAENGFGATFTVVKADTIHILLKMKNDKDFTSTSFVCPMDAQTAMSVKPSLGILVVCQLAEQTEQGGSGAPYLGSEAFTDEPTVQFPHEGLTTRIFIQSTFKEILIYNTATGKVLLTIKPKGAKT